MNPITRTVTGRLERITQAADCRSWVIWVEVRSEYVAFEVLGIDFSLRGQTVTLRFAETVAANGAGRFEYVYSISGPTSPQDAVPMMTDPDAESDNLVAEKGILYACDDTWIRGIKKRLAEECAGLGITEDEYRERYYAKGFKMKMRREAMTILDHPPTIEEVKAHLAANCVSGRFGFVGEEFCAYLVHGGRIPIPWVLVISRTPNGKIYSNTGYGHGTETYDPSSDSRYDMLRCKYLPLGSDGLPIRNDAANPAGVNPQP